MDWTPQQIDLARRLDALSSLSLSLLPGRNGGPPATGEVRRVLFVKLWGLGSIVLAEPALRLLRKRYPSARLDVLTADANRDLLGLVPAVGRIHTLRARGPLSLPWEALGLSRRLRRQRYDLVFDAEFLAAFSGWFCSRLGAGCVVGFESRAKSRWQHVSVPYRPEPHAVHQFLNLVRLRAAAVPARRPRLRRPSCPNPLGGDRPYVVLNVNAGPLALERRWPRSRFVQLGRALLDALELDLVLIGSPAERSYVRSVERELASARVCNLSGGLGVQGLAALLAGATALISNDSGPVHLASAYDVPVVAFYGPETPRRYGPTSSRSLVFHRQLQCSPCMSDENGKAVRCPHQRRCLMEIRSDAVIVQVRRFLEPLLEQPRRARAHG